MSYAPISDELRNALRAADDDAIVGLPESATLDFKRGHGFAPRHRTVSRKDRWELAKDVAAFANAQGGVIVYGVVTTSAETTNVDVADEIVGAGPVDFDRMRAVLAEYLHPAQSVHMDQSDNGRLVWIEVPPAAVGDHPVLVRKQFDPESDKTVDSIGVPTRVGDHTVWRTAADLHGDLRLSHDVRHAIRAGTVAPTGFASTQAWESGITDQVHDVIDHIEARDAGWLDHEILALVARPHVPLARVKGAADPQGLLGAFSNPPVLRPNGFGIGGNPSQFAEHDLDGVLVAQEGHLLRLLWPDGVFACANAVEASHLGRTPNPPQEPRVLAMLNLAFAEYVLEFFRFLTDQLATEDMPWEVAYGVRGARTRPWRLGVGRRSAFQWPPGNHREASADTWTAAIGFTGDPPADAYRVMEDFYGRHGIENDLPFTAGSAVDVDKIIGQG